jgi:hypothetical protein
VAGDFNNQRKKTSSMKSQRVDTWAATIPDRPGSLTSKLKALTAGGVNLELVIARRIGAKGDKSIVFVTPIKGAKQVSAAAGAGFTKTTSLHTLRVEGVNKPGQGAQLTALLADKGLNLRGLSAAAIGRKFICHIALDTEADVAKAARALSHL